jgi:transposase, IS5 family
MARRQIGQEAFAFVADPASHCCPLDRLSEPVDWSSLDRYLVDIYAAKGEPAWPPLVLFRALLLAVWYDLSDVRLAEALEDRASFRRFCGFAAHEPTPERTASVRFRRELVWRGLEGPVR